jgi:cobalamin biosynthesis protein CbiG
MLRYPLSTVILAGAADHPQYPDAKLDDLIYQTQDSEYLKHRRFAKVAGFSLDNPTTFFIQHVYCSQVNQIFPSKSENSIALMSPVPLSGIS